MFRSLIFRNLSLSSTHPLSYTYTSTVFITMYKIFIYYKMTFECIDLASVANTSVLRPPKVDWTKQ